MYVTTSIVRTKRITIVLTGKADVSNLVGDIGEKWDTNLTGETVF